MRQITHTKPGAHTNPNTTMQPVVVRLYTRLYSAFFGLVSQPAPLGALKPRLCRMYRLADKRADKRFFKLGTRKPNFMVWVVRWVIRKAWSSAILYWYSVVCIVFPFAVGSLFLSNLRTLVGLIVDVTVLLFRTPVKINYFDLQMRMTVMGIKLIEITGQ
jgi:hypothetical protein